MTIEPSADAPNAPAVATPAGRPSDTKPVEAVQRNGTDGNSPPDQLVPPKARPTTSVPSGVTLRAMPLLEMVFNPSDADQRNGAGVVLKPGNKKLLRGNSPTIIAP